MNILNPQSKLLWHGDRVKSWLEGATPPPVLVEIAPVGYCNASCPWCFFKDKNDGGRIDPKVMLNTLRVLKWRGVKAVNWTGGGEPTIHPDFESFVYRAKELGLEQGLFTNAYVEVPNLFKWVRVSLTDREFDFKTPKGYFGVCVNLLPNTKEEKLIEWCRKARDLRARYFQVRPALIGHWSKQPILTPPVYLKDFETPEFKVFFRR